MVRVLALLGFLALGAAAALSAPATADDAAMPIAASAADRHADKPPPAHHEAPAAQHRGDDRHAAPPHRDDHAAAPARRAPPRPARREGGCVSQRGMIAVVQAGRAVPLSAIRADAERRGNGELINAELCGRGGRLVYLVSVLGENGKVEHMSFDAASGRIEGGAR